MDILITLTTAGANIGPTFDLYSNVDNYATAFVTNVSKTSLLSGYYTNLAPIGTTIIRVKSMGVDCTNFVTVAITPPTTTTTTTYYPITVDFDLEIVTTQQYANPAILSSNYTGGPSGQYIISDFWYTTKEEAEFVLNFTALPYTFLFYYYSGNNQPPINYGFPPGTYWFAVRDKVNYKNMRAKSITVLPSTTSTTTTALILSPIFVYINFTSGNILCTNPTSEPSSVTIYCTTSTLQANSKIYYSNGTGSPAANGLYVSAGLVSGVPGPVFKVIDNFGTLASHTC